MISFCHCCQTKCHWSNDQPCSNFFAHYFTKPNSGWNEDIHIIQVCGFHNWQARRIHLKRISESELLAAKVLQS